MCDANEHLAGNVLLTENYKDMGEGTHKFHAPVAFGSRQPTTGQMPSTMYVKNFLATSLAFDELPTNCEPTIVMTDNRTFSISSRRSRYPQNSSILRTNVSVFYVFTSRPGPKIHAAVWWLKIEPQHRINLKSTNNFTVYRIDFDLAPKTLKQTTTKNNMTSMHNPDNLSFLPKRKCNNLTRWLKGYPCDCTKQPKASNAAEHKWALISWPVAWRNKNSITSIS